MKRYYRIVKSFNEFGNPSYIAMRSRGLFFRYITGSWWSVIGGYDSLEVARNMIEFNLKCDMGCGIEGVKL